MRNILLKPFTLYIALINHPTSRKFLLLGESADFCSGWKRKYQNYSKFIETIHNNNVHLINTPSTDATWAKSPHHLSHRPGQPKTPPWKKVQSIQLCGTYTDNGKCVWDTERQCERVAYQFYRRQTRTTTGVFGEMEVRMKMQLRVEKVLQVKISQRCEGGVTTRRRRKKWLVSNETMSTDF